MMYRTHFGTGLLFGLTADLALAAAGHPLPVEQAVALPVACGYFSAIPDVDHHNAKIRFAVPPARWLYLLVQLLVGLSGGRPRWRLTWRLVVIPRLRLVYSAKGQRRVDYWMDHRRVTHTLDFAVWLGLLAALPVWWFGLWWWLAPAVTLGCWAHRLGDRLTDRGVPAWSWRLDARHRWKVNTDSFGESAFGWGQSLACVGLCWLLIGAPVPTG